MDEQRGESEEKEVICEGIGESDMEELVTRIRMTKTYVGFFPTSYYIPLRHKFIHYWNAIG